MVVQRLVTQERVKWQLYFHWKILATFTNNRCYVIAIKKCSSVKDAAEWFFIKRHDWWNWNQIRNRPAPHGSLKLIASIQGNTYGGWSSRMPFFRDCKLIPTDRYKSSIGLCLCHTFTWIQQWELTLTFVNNRMDKFKYSERNTVQTIAMCNDMDSQAYSWVNLCK